MGQCDYANRAGGANVGAGGRGDGMKRHPVLIATLCCLGLPLLGIAFCDRPLLSYLEFPPLTRYVPHAPFSWPPFIALALLIVATLTPFIRRLSAAPLILPHPSSLPPPASSLLPHPSSFPWWGWLGLAAGVCIGQAI